MNGSQVFLLNLVSTWYMVGLIWMVQIVHYNMFDRVGVEQFSRYAADHNRLITPIVGVPMLLEIGSAAALLFLAPAGFPRWAALVGIFLVAAIWISTAALQIPCHQRLMTGFDETAYQRLVSTNWIRTILWSVRGVLMTYFASNMIR